MLQFRCGWVGVVSVWQAEAVLSIVSPHWLYVLVSMYVAVSVWLVGVVSVWQAEAVTDTTPTSHTETATHIETRTYNQCGDTIEKSQASDDGLLMSETCRA